METSGYGKRIDFYTLISGILTILELADKKLSLSAYLKIPYIHENNRICRKIGLYTHVSRILTILKQADKKLSLSAYLKIPYINGNNRICKEKLAFIRISQEFLQSWNKRIKINFANKNTVAPKQILFPLYSPKHYLLTN